MKKLISAASALAMAASMVGAAVSFTTGAADASKGFELKAFTNKAGEAVKTTISAEEIAAGDVTIPIAIYLNENTPDIQTINAQFYVDSKDGDASNKYVSFSNYYVPGDVYFDSAQAVTIADGSTIDTDLVVGFSGTLMSTKKGSVFIDNMYQGLYTAKENNKTYGVDTAWASVVWQPAAGTPDTWTGATSDEFPIMIVDATFAKGTPAGTYTIDFLNKTDDKGVPTTFIEAGVPMVKYNPANNNLNLKGMEIVIEGDTKPVATTTAAPAPSTTTTSATTATPAPVTTAPNSGDDDTFEVAADFIVSGKDYTVKPGEEIDVEFIVDPGSHVGSTFAAELADLPAGITAKMTDPLCYAAGTGTNKYTLYNGISYQVSVLDKKTSKPVEIEKDEAIIQFTLTIPDDIASGEYEYALSKFRVVEYGQKTADHDVSKFDATLVPGKLVVEGGTPAGTTTAPAPSTTTAAPAPSTTTAAPVTTATPIGNVLYGDTNCDGEVRINDVVALNKWLNDAKSYDMKPQGKINADCCDEKGGEGLDKNDSDAIIRRIVHLVELPCKSSDLK
ncbi:MAG: hypothetical protein K2J47_07265 [Ruminococcus sp.]|nr:hypothetical protein [Ruminococcus sp.]